MNKRLIVTGTPGAWFNSVNRKLVADDWAIVWPGQDLDIYHGRRYLEANWHNIEVYNIIYHVCEFNNTVPWSDNLPKFYDLPYPGPQEFVDKFPGPMIISSIYLAPFLDIWAPVCDTVIDIKATESEDLLMLKLWSQGKLDETKLRAIRVHHLSRYDEHLKLFPKVFTMTNADVKGSRFEGLNEFLTSAF
jgi:hypothetical protein